MKVYKLNNNISQTCENGTEVDLYKWTNVLKNSFKITQLIKKFLKCSLFSAISWEIKWSF